MGSGKGHGIYSPCLSYVLRQHSCQVVPCPQLPLSLGSRKNHLFRPRSGLKKLIFLPLLSSGSSSSFTGLLNPILIHVVLSFYWIPLDYPSSVPSVSCQDAPISTTLSLLQDKGLHQKPSKVRSAPRISLIIKSLLEPLYTVAGNVNNVVAMENGMAFSQKIKHRITVWSSNSISRYMPKRTECNDSNIFVQPCSWQHYSQQTNVGVIQASIDRWLGKQNVEYNTMDYYSALKGKEILKHSTRGMNLEDVMQSEISQSQNTNTVWFHLYEIPGMVRKETHQDQGGGNGSYYVIGMEFQFHKMKRVLGVPM